MKHVSLSNIKKFPAAKQLRMDELLDKNNDR